MRAHLIIAAALAAIVPAGAFAQPYKCVGPDGKVSFSDQRCEADRPKVKADFEVSDKDAKGLTAADRERIKALDAVTLNKAANSEQKTAAQLEAGNIRRGLEGQLSAEDKAKRESLTKELAATEPDKRAAALRQLRALYKD
jgi:hypothetical protein